MADLELMDALTDAPPQIEPDIKRDFISSLEAEPYDDVIGEKCDKTDYIPLLDDDEADGPGEKRSAEGSHPSVVENGEHNMADIGVSDPFGSAGDEDVLTDFLLPPEVQICPAFPGSTEAAFNEGWLTDSYSKSGDTDTQSADASEKTSATFGETPSEESDKNSFQVHQSDTTSHIWQPTKEEKIALSPYSPEHEGLKSEEFDEASCTESQLLPGLGSTYLEPQDEDEFPNPYSYDQEITSTSTETPNPTTGNNVQESSQDEAVPVLQSVECDQSKEELGAEQVTPQTSIEPPPSPAAQSSADTPVSPVELIHKNSPVSAANQFPAEILGEFHEEASPAFPAALDLENNAPAAPASLDPETESPASPPAIDLEKESPASPAGIDLQAESPASPAAINLKKESPASPAALYFDKESPASPAALYLEKESPASPAALYLEKESPASPAALYLEKESPASPAALDLEAEAVTSPVALVQLEKVPASPFVLAEEPLIPVSPVALVQEAAAPSSPIALIREEVSASPVALVQEAEAPTSPVALVQEVEVATSPVGLVLEAEVPASPVALVQESATQASLNALTKDVEAPASPAALNKELETPSPLTASVQEELASPAEGSKQPEAPPVRDDLQHLGDQGKLEAVAATEDPRTGSDITAPPTKELPASPEKKVKASAATATKTAATPKGKPLAAPSPKKPLSSTPIQAKKASPAPAAANNTATPKRPLGSALKTATPKEAKPKSLDLKSPVNTTDKKPLTSATTPRSAVKASPAASKLGTSTAANTTGTSAPKLNATPKRPTSLKNDVKAAEAKKTTSTRSPTELSRPKTVPADLTKSNGPAPVSPSRPKTSKPAASKPVTGPSASADAKKQPITRPAPLSKTSTAPASKPSSALAASRPSAAPKQPRPATAPDLKNVRSKIGSTDNLKHQPGGGKQVKVEKKPVPVSTVRKPAPAPAATKAASAKPADPKETAQKQSNGKVTSAAKPSIGSSRPPASTSHKPGGSNVQILNKKVDVSKVSSKCGSKPGLKAKSGAADAKSESSRKTETEKKEPQENIKENGGEPITPPQDTDIVTPTDNTAVDTRENGIPEMPPVDSSNQRDIQSFNSLIPETN